MPRMGQREMDAGGAASHLEGAGVLYVATGAAFVEAALRSSESLKRRHPHLPVHLCADWRRCGLDPERYSATVDSWEEIAEPDARNRRFKRYNL